jgi:hypothetical protein
MTKNAPHVAGSGQLQLVVFDFERFDHVSVLRLSATLAA